MKKIVIGIFLIMLVVLLTGCRRGIFKPEILDENIFVVEAWEPDITSTRTHDFPDMTIVSTNRLDRSGAVVVLNNDNHFGVFSLVLDTMIIPFNSEIDNIFVAFDNVFGAYLEVEYDNGDEAVFDVLGNTALERDTYDWFDVVGGMIIENDTILYKETINYQNAEAGIVTYVNHVYIETGERSKQEAVTYNYGDIFDDGKLGHIDLKQVGLEGYYYTMTDNFMRVYRERNDREVAAFMRPNVHPRMMFDGVMFYQVVRNVPKDGADYTFIDGNNAFLLETFAIDLTSGETEALDVDYVIHGIDPFRASDGTIQYARVRVHRVIEGHLANEVEHAFIINSDGKIVSDVTGINFNNLVRISEERIYDVQRNELLDNDLKRIFTMPQVLHHMRIEDDTLFISRHNGFVGALDQEGRVKIPFIYNDVSHFFYEGKTIAEGSDDKHYIVDLENNQTLIDAENVMHWTYGRYFTYGTPNNDGELDVYLRDYDQSTITTFTINVPNLNNANWYDINNVFFRATIYRVNKTGMVWDNDDFYYITVKFNE